jgi:transcriptional regulator with XRE-family HTH domain
MRRASDTDLRSAQVDVAVGSAIDTALRKVGLSQVELATALQVDARQIERFCKGHERVPASLLCDIAMILETSITDLFFGIDDESARPSDNSQKN